MLGMYVFFTPTSNHLNNIAIYIEILHNLIFILVSKQCHNTVLKCCKTLIWTIKNNSNFRNVDG